MEGSATALNAVALPDIVAFGRRAIAMANRIRDWGGGWQNVLEILVTIVGVPVFLLGFVVLDLATPVARLVAPLAVPFDPLARALDTFGRVELAAFLAGVMSLFYYLIAREPKRGYKSSVHYRVMRTNPRADTSVGLFLLLMVCCFLLLMTLKVGKA